MTYEEAITLIEEIRPRKCKMVDGRLQGGYPDHDSDIGKAIDMAIEALEKQIPKKPICVEDKMWCCPVCDNNLLHKWVKYPTKLAPKSAGLPYCMSCGQRIDWSEA